MLDIQQMSDSNLGRLWATRNLPPQTAEQVVAEIYRRQMERLNAYQYYGSKQHLEDMRNQLLMETHADTAPPWEDEEEYTNSNA